MPRDIAADFWRGLALNSISGSKFAGTKTHRRGQFAPRPFGDSHQSGDFRGSLFETSSLVQITTNSALRQQLDRRIQRPQKGTLRTRVESFRRVRKPSK